MAVNSSPGDKPGGLSQQEAEALLRQYGYNETNEKKIPGWKLFLRKFWNLSSWMLESVIILSLVLGNYPDAAVVTLVLLINSITVYIQDHRAMDAVDSLKKRLQISVNTFRDNEWKGIPARELVPGDTIRLRTGDFVPADLHIREGNGRIDQSSLTGENGDIEKKENDTIYSGSVITQGEITASVTSTGPHTYYGKTIELLKTAAPKSHMDEIISKVIRWLSLVIGVMLIVALVISILRGISILSILPLMVILFMNAIPVALSVLFSFSNAIGARQLLSQGVLVTRMNAPGDAAGMNILCTDKTGTLTMNQLSIVEIIPAPNFKEQDVLLYGILASQEANQDEIDMAFLEAGKQQKIGMDGVSQKSFTPFTPERRRTEAVIQEKDREYSVYKGAFDGIAGLTGPALSQDPEWKKRIDDSAAKGYRTIAVARTAPDHSVELVGVVALEDLPREESVQIISQLKESGISVLMLTGDALPVAKEVAAKTGIGTKIIRASEPGGDKEMAAILEKVNGVAEVYPEDKYKIVKALQAKGHIVGMTGDGVNDAPALQQAEVGIAVNNAADVAKKSASIILTRDGLQGVLAPVKIGRVMFERIKLWILNKFSRTLLKICFIVLALILFGKYVVSTTVMLLLLVVTDFAIISTSNDKVPVSSGPDQRNINQLAKTGSLLGILMAMEALGLLYIGWNYFDLARNDGQLYTFSLITLLFFSLAVFFSIREKGHFWNSRPGLIDSGMLAACFAGGLIVSFTGFLELKPIPFTLTLSVIIYVIVMTFGVNDYIKYRIYINNGKYQAAGSHRRK